MTTSELKPWLLSVLSDPTERDGCENHVAPPQTFLLFHFNEKPIHNRQKPPPRRHYPQPVPISVVRNGPKNKPPGLPSGKPALGKDETQPSRTKILVCDFVPLAINVWRAQSAHFAPLVERRQQCERRRNEEKFTFRV